MRLRGIILAVMPMMAGADPLHLMFPAPDQYVPACQVAATGDTIAVHVTVEGSLDQIAMLETGKSALPSWQLTAQGVPGVVTLTSSGGDSLMVITPAIQGPQVVFDSELAVGPGLDGPATYNFMATDAAGEFIPGPVVMITRNPGDCPGACRPAWHC